MEDNQSLQEKIAEIQKDIKEIKQALSGGLRGNGLVDRVNSIEKKQKLIEKCVITFILAVVGFAAKGTWDFVSKKELKLPSYHTSLKKEDNNISISAEAVKNKDHEKK